MTIHRNTAIAFLALVLACPFAFGQANDMPFTALSAALDATSQTLTVTSATGIAAPTGTSFTLLLMDKEAMRVTADPNGTIISVQRGVQGTGASSHASGTRVWVGPAKYYGQADPSGSCTLANLTVHPRVVIPSGNVWYCSDGLWTRTTITDYDTARYLGTAATGVTAVEQGIGRIHVTTLTFTNQTVGSPAGAAALAFGKLLYTLPAGAVIVKSSYISVGLNCTGAVVTADTPDVGLGTVVASGANALLSAAPAGSETILTGQTAANVNNTATLFMVSNSLANVAAADAHTVYLNVADTWAGADTVRATGTVVLEWVILK